MEPWSLCNERTLITHYTVIKVPWTESFVCLFWIYLCICFNWIIIYIIIHGANQHPCPSKGRRTPDNGWRSNRPKRKDNISTQDEDKSLTTNISDYNLSWNNEGHGTSSIITSSGPLRSSRQQWNNAAKTDVNKTWKLAPGSNISVYKIAKRSEIT